MVDGCGRQLQLLPGGTHDHGMVFQDDLVGLDISRGHQVSPGVFGETDLERVATVDTCTRPEWSESTRVREVSKKNISSWNVAR